MRLSVLFNYVYWSAALLFLIDDLAAPGTLAFGALTGVFHAAELYLAMDLLSFFVGSWRKRRKQQIIRSALRT